ncbi:MAG: hypothetical protein P0Y65_05795 [Candidatus Devosia phytovorans]|uniref:Uncharacterized protein n=1 Tax=Candidatus Devosia phytovorans TaxID=3121372 RepID=A0AAJ6B2S4_9HYPH|nr:hypothetical protein [Devosia sp.]WEK05768.1 MAG: hypothetical protein P0Y65_05795 [Devosia sp.]
MNLEDRLVEAAKDRPRGGDADNFLSPRQVTVHNEKTKMLASGIDRAGTACLTVGTLTPVAAYLFNIANARTTFVQGELVWGIVVWLVAAIALHVMARMVLGDLQ